MTGPPHGWAVRDGNGEMGAQDKFKVGDYVILRGPEFPEPVRVDSVAVNGVNEYTLGFAHPYDGRRVHVGGHNVTRVEATSEPEVIDRPYIAADGVRFATREDSGEASPEDIADSRAADTASTEYASLKAMAESMVTDNPTGAGFVQCSACNVQAETYVHAYDSTADMIYAVLAHAAFDHTGRASVNVYSIDRTIRFTD